MQTDFNIPYLYLTLPLPTSPYLSYQLCKQRHGLTMDSHLPLTIYPFRLLLLYDYQDIFDRLDLLRSSFFPFSLFPFFPFSMMNQGKISA